MLVVGSVFVFELREWKALSSSSLTFPDRYVSRATPELADRLREHNAAVAAAEDECSELSCDVDSLLLLGEMGEVQEMLAEIAAAAGNKIRAMLIRKDVAGAAALLWSELRRQVEADLEQAREAYSAAFQTKVAELTKAGVPLKWLEGPNERKLTMQSRQLVESALKGQRAAVAEATDLLRSTAERETDATLQVRQIDYQISEAVKAAAGIRDGEKIPAMLR